MSKGIGSSYIDRMKRWHVPSSNRILRDSHNRIVIICDRAFYHDGKFKYKLPRYYKDRLYRKKYPCDVNVWNQKLKIYEKKTVYRYLSKNMLSLQMQDEIRKRVLADYHRRFAEFKSLHPNFSDVEVDIALIRNEKRSRMDRQKDLFSKHSRFYNGQRFKNREF